MNIIGIIPARLESTRLNRKLLVDIHGKPMIQHVWERTRKANLNKVIVATDSKEIYDVCKGFGADVEYTSKSHISGTGRLGEISSKYNADFYVNIQGDEPLISFYVINELIELMKSNSKRDIYTIATELFMEEEYYDSNIVKVVLDNNRDALYFSRSPIPYYRDGIGSNKPLSYKHIGIYGYTPKALDFYSTSNEGTLERLEKLEQLRFIENGYKIRVLLTKYESIGVDTTDDLKKVRNLIEKE